MALLGALQPLVVGVDSFLFLHERLPGRGWAGLLIGLARVVLVLAPLLEHGFGMRMPACVVEKCNAGDRRHGRRPGVGMKRGQSG